MYECKKLPIADAKNQVVYGKARSLLTKWLEGSPKSAKGEPYVWVKCFGGRDQLFLDWFEPHLNKKKGKNRLSRYRLIPCVKELLEKTKDEAVPMNEPTKNEPPKWGLSGIIPAYHGQYFWVIIGLKPTGEYYLNTCYRKS